METEDLVVDQSSKREVVEQICEVFPDIGVAVFAQALIVEAVHLGNLTRLVVSTEDRNTLGIPNLQRHKKSHSLD